MLRPVTRLLVSVCAAATWSAAIATAQGRWIDFEHIDFGTRVPDAPIRCVQQDALGFLWIGSRDGLWRHDGFEPRAIALPPFDDLPDTSERILCMAPAADGGIWLGTPRGLLYAAAGGDEAVAYDPHASDATPLPSQAIFDLCVDARGRVWLVGTQFSRFDPATGELERFDAPSAASLVDADGSVRPTGAVLRVATDPRGNVWAVTSRGDLARIDARTDDARSFDCVTRLETTRRPRLVRDLWIVDDQPWVSTDEGILRVDPSTNTCAAVAPDSVDGPNADQVLTAVRDPDGQLWLGMESTGLVLLEAPGATPIRFQRQPYRPSSLPSDTVTCLLLDHDGSLWVGTRHGLARCDPRPRVACYEIDRSTAGDGGERRGGAIHEGPDGSVWFGDGERGLGRLTPDGNLQFLSCEALAMDPAVVLAIAPAPNAHLWLATSNGLQLLDPVAHRVVARHRHDPEDTASLSDDDLRGLCRGPDGALWVLTARGIDRFDEGAGSVRRFAPPPSAGDLDGLRFVSYGLHPGTAGELWAIAIGRGLLRVEPRTGTITHVAVRTAAGENLLRSRPLFAVADAGEHLWLATQGGLVRCRRDGSDARLAAEDERLQRNSVSTVQLSASGTLWVGTTSHGLFAVGPDGRTLAQITRSDGLGGDGATLGSQHATGSGEIWFGTGRHVVRIDERRALERRPPPRVVLTDFLVRGERRTEALRTGAVALPYTANYFSFSFAALDSLAPEAARCAYQLEGVDQDWVDAGPLHSVRYSNVAPGTYRFRVRAAGSDGTWSAPSPPFEVTVAAPLWETTPFRLAIVAAALLLLGSYWRYARALAHRGRRLQQEYEERMRAEEQSRQLEQQLRRSQKMQAIGRLAGGVAHDFNNMLTAILGHTEVAREIANEGGPREEVLTSLDEIHHAAQRAAALTRQLLMFSRGQSSGAATCHANDVLRDLERLIRPLVREDVVAELSLAPHLPHVAIDAMQLGQVVLNLVVNASDAMPDGGRLTIATARSEEGPGMVTIAVTDTGPGIPREQLDRIFEPFFTTKPVGEGTGLGLATVHAIVTQANGKIDVASEPGRGSTFRITLPIAASTPDGGTSSSDPVHATAARTILVCEDDDSVRELTTRILRTHGFHVVSCATPAAALEAARDPTLDVHLLLTDVIMPLMNGRELAEAVLRTRPSLPVLFASGYPADVLSGRGMTLDEVRYLPKPFSADELVAEVRGALEPRA